MFKLFVKISFDLLVVKFKYKINSVFIKNLNKINSAFIKNFNFIPMKFCKFIVSFIATIGYAKLTTYKEFNFLTRCAPFLDLLENEYYERRFLFRKLYNQSKEYFAMLKSTSDNELIINDYPIEKVIKGETLSTLRQIYFVSVLNNYCLNSFVFNYHIEKCFTELCVLRGLKNLLCSERHLCFIKDVNHYILEYGVLKYELIEQNKKFLDPYFSDQGKFGPDELITPVVNILLESIDCHQNCIFSILKIIEDMKNNIKNRDVYMDNLMDLMKNGFFPSKGAYYKLEHEIINYLNETSSQANFILQESIKNLKKARGKSINFLNDLMKAHLPVLLKEKKDNLSYDHVFPMLPDVVREMKADVVLLLISDRNRKITSQPLSRYPFLVMKKSIRANLLVLYIIMEITSFRIQKLASLIAFSFLYSHVHGQQGLYFMHCSSSFWNFHVEKFNPLNSLFESMSNAKDVKVFKRYLFEAHERLRQVEGIFHLSNADKDLMKFFDCMHKAFKSVSSNIQNSISYFEHYKFNFESYLELKHANPVPKNEKENCEIWCPNIYISRATSLINSEIKKLLEDSN